MKQDNEGACRGRIEVEIVKVDEAVAALTNWAVRSDVSRRAFGSAVGAQMHNYVASDLGCSGVAVFTLHGAI
jgi:hypothetical protein